MKPVNPLESWCSYQGGKDKNSASSNNYNNDRHFLLLVSPNQTLSTLHTLSGKPSQQSWNKRDDCLHLIQQMRKLPQGARHLAQGLPTGVVGQGLNQAV